MKKDFSFSDILQNMKEVFSQKYIQIIIFFLIETAILITFNFYYMEDISNIRNNHANSTNSIMFLLEPKYIILFSLSIVLYVLIVGSLVRFSYDVIMGDKLCKRVSYTKQYVNFILNSLFLNLVVGLIFTVYIIFMLFFTLMPAIGIILVILGSLAFICFILYFMGYYRFMPYIALFDGRQTSFVKSYDLVSGHLLLSISVLIISGIITMIFNSFNSTANITIVIISIVTSVVSYLIVLFDISFILTSFKNKKENIKLESINEGIQMSAEEDIITDI